MATVETDDLSSQAPPFKRARLDNYSPNIDSTTVTNDMEDSSNAEGQEVMPMAAPEASIQPPVPQEKSTAAQFVIPGLGRIENLSAVPAPVAEDSPQPPVIGEINKSLEGELITNGLPQMSGLENGSPVKESLPPIEMEIEVVDAIGSKAEPNLANSAPVEENTFDINNQVATEGKPDTLENDSEPSFAGKMEVEEDAKSPKIDVDSSNQELEGEKMDTVENQPVTHALEALLGGLDSPNPSPDLVNETATEEKDGNPEWEVDSSPYESSSDSSSDDSSSEEDSDEDEENAYKLLSPEEQARILMEGDGGSDDEGGAAKTKGPGGQLRTKNEVPEEVISKPDVIITPNMRIEELGVVETIVDSIILIKAKTSGEYRALESGSVLCLEDRTVFGVVSETLGRVQQPLYTVRFTNNADIIEAGLSLGTKVFYSEVHAVFALTQVLKAYKGSDASNLHDEEVGDEEIEFSDDEAEAEHKRRLKHKKLEKRGGKMQQNGGHGRAGPHGHPLQQQHLPPTNGGLSYDDEDEGPYKPLTRPNGFADTVGRSEAPQEGAYPLATSNRGRGDFRGRGRGDRGRGRGDRGRGRGGFQDRRDNNGFAQPPLGHPQSSPAISHTPSPYTHATSASQSPNSFYTPQAQSTPQQPIWSQYPQQHFQQPYQGFPTLQNGWPNMPGPPLTSGAFINPAFFPGNQQNPPNQWQQGQHNGRGRGSSP